jgi:uncharacterized protein YpuA (DUF1002 family)
MDDRHKTERGLETYERREFLGGSCTMLWLTNKKLRQCVASLTLFSLILVVFPVLTLADAVEGTTVVTLGEDLTAEQKTQMLNEMNVGEDVKTLFVSNEEEHQYLGEYISASQIGSKAISSAKITLTPEGSGLQVETKNITWVSEAMYANALATAGVKDADVHVTAPFEVSGTAGLTGILKAFEVAAGTEISEEQKQVANEEMVRTAELAEKIGAAKATELMIRLKEALGDTKLETDEDYRNLVLTVAAELNIELSDKDVDALVHLLKRLKGLNINWDQLGNQLKNIRDNLDEFLDREETRNFIRQFLDFLVGLIEQLKALFS